MSLPARLYGIPNCDKVRAARAWLAQRGIEVEFHDFKRDGVDRRLIADWFARAPWSEFVNRKGTTWRRLPEARREAIASAAAAAALMQDEPSVIRRPVLDAGGRLEVGFDAQAYTKIFGAK